MQVIPVTYDSSLPKNPLAPSRTPRSDWKAPEPVIPQRRKLRYRPLTDVETEDVKWLWYPFIPASKLTLIEGDPGQGKSFMTAAIAADLSAGRPLPGMKTPLPPQRILMLSAEDGLGDTVKPRIEAMKGNMDNIFVSDDFFILDKNGIEDMEEMMRTTAATIVFMDPIVAYMGAKVDMHRANEVRGLMTALAEAAKRTGTAVVAVRHLRKAGINGGKGKAIYSGIGSIDFTAAVRSVMQVQETQTGKKFMFHAKHNLTPKGPALAYSINEQGQFRWEGELSSDDIEVSSKRQKPAVSTVSRAIADAQDFLKAILKDGPQLTSLVMDEAAKRSISEQSLQRAKPGLARSVKVGHTWMWELQEHLRPEPKATDPEVERLVSEALARLKEKGELK